MSDTNKSSLWQKIIKLLNAAAPKQKASAEDKTAASAPSNTDMNAHNAAKKDIDDNEQAHAITPDNNAVPATKAEGSGDDHAATTQSQHPNATDKPHTESQADHLITDTLKDYLDNQQWHYSQYQPKAGDDQQTMHLSLRMRHKGIECGYLFRIQESNGLLAVYGILPFLIPDSHQSAAMLLITQINYDMIIGNLEMDVNDGEIRYKHAIDVEAVGINDQIIDHLLQSVVAMTTVAHDVFSDLLNTQDPAADIPTLLGELQQQSEARTFFLPTQLVQ